jgi:tetratricopeptide (TPR) repeat protein
MMSVQKDSIAAAPERFALKGRRLQMLIHLFLVVFLGSIIYSNTLQSPFVFDDESYIHDNPVLRDLRGFGDARYAEKLMSKGVLDQNFRTRIVTFFTFAVNYQFLGNSLVGYHLVNLVIHLLNGILVYFLMRQTLRTPFARGDGGGGTSSGTTAMLTALLFVSHPVQTQAVTYISQRFTSLATLFCLLSLVAYGGWRLALPPAGEASEKSLPGYLGERPGLYGLALFSTVLAMKTKEISFTLPLLLCLYEYSFFTGTRRRWVVLLPFLLTMAIIPLSLFGEKAKYDDISYLTESLGKTGLGAPLLYLCTEFRVIVTYLRLLLLPVQQNLDYAYPIAEGFFQAPVILSFLLLITLAGLGVYLMVRSRRVSEVRQALWLRVSAFGIFWFFLALSVESSVIVLRDVIFEHRLYLPFVGFALVLVAVSQLIRARVGLTGGRILTAGMVGLILLWSGAAYLRNSVWRDPVLLWTDTVQKSPDKYRPHFALGNAYSFRGLDQEAIHEYREALRFEPTSVEAYGHLAEIYLRHRDFPAALAMLEQAAKCPDADSAPQLYNTLGELYLRAGRLPEAEAALAKAIPLDDHPEVPLRKLGELYLQQKRFAEARKALEAALKLDPANATISYDLGLASAAMGEK